MGRLGRNPPRPVGFTPGTPLETLFDADADVSVAMESTPLTAHHMIDVVCVWPVCNGSYPPDFPTADRSSDSVSEVRRALLQCSPRSCCICSGWRSYLLGFICVATFCSSTRIEHLVLKMDGIYYAITQRKNE